MQNEKVQNKEMDEFETGTTTLGLTTDKGAILAADKRAALGGRLVSNKHAQKIYELDDEIGLTIAGSVGDAQKVVRMMRSQLNMKKLETRELSVKGAGTLLANILHANKMMPFMNQFVLGGIQEGEGILYSLDPAGGLMPHEDYTATGSGSQMAFGVLEDGFEHGISHEEGKELAMNAVKSAMERDTASGNGIMVAEITEEDGYNVIEDLEEQSELE
ncbi:MAG: 20S proteasome, beta subunit [Candidatus Nanosalina sp. J07AB43]|nr:MAG: 20S proteasome, beta subunit [Candidatus Nanosalina sp. J07AB43]